MTPARALLAALAAAALIGGPGAHPSGAALRGDLDPLGYDPISARGLNSTVAIGGGYAYVGSFGDTSVPEAGVAILSLSDPLNPRQVASIPPRPGQGSNEVRLWPRKEILIVSAPPCDPFCQDPGAAVPQLLFYDVAGANATAPVLIATVQFPADPHELYLWQDPRRADRALLYVTTSRAGAPNLIVYDLSEIRAGSLRLLDSWTLPTSRGRFGLHTVSVSADGRRAFAAANDAGYFLLSTSEFARGKANPRIRPLTPLRRAVTYKGVNGHSAIELPGRPFALVSDEIYGCPWGWARVLDVSDPRRPRIVGQMRAPPYNNRSLCRASTPRDAELVASAVDQSFSAHDLTASCDLMLASWYGSGVQAFDLKRPAEPRRVAAFVPEPLSSVQTEYPPLLGVAMHSHVIVDAGLLYVVDIRNGLFVLRYSGPRSGQVSGAGYLAGNSNLSGNAGLRSLPPGGGRCRQSRSSSARR